MFKWLSFCIISPVRSFFLLIIKHHKFLIELRNIIHTGASKLDSIHIQWFGLFSNGFHSFGCNSILSGIYIQLELIFFFQKKPNTQTHTTWTHSTRRVSNEDAVAILNSSIKWDFFFVVFIETHWSGKRLKSCKKRIKCDEMTRKKWIKITKTFFLLSWLGIFWLNLLI